MLAVDSILGIKAPQTEAQRRTYAARVAKARKYLMRAGKPTTTQRAHRRRSAIVAQAVTPTTEIKALGKVTTVLIALPLEARARVLTLARTFVLGEASESPA